jgi:iron complex outermembrane receptor protein
MPLTGHRVYGARALLSVLLLFAGTAPVQAARLAPDPADSAVVEGVVVDARTGRPMVGTLVRVLQLGRQDVTHDAGEYHLTNLPAGRHTLVFEHLGYRREVRQVELAARQVLKLDVELQASAIILPDIVVTGSARESLGDRAIRPASVVSGQELARKLDVTLASTLENEPGLASTSVGPATSRPIIRGLGGDRVLVLEDGARVGDLSSSSSDHALSVDPVTAQRIEVVRGPGALLYGSNAIGGVINLIREEVPASVPERPTGVASLQAQSVNRGAAAGASGQVGMGRIALRGEGSFRDAGDLHTPEGTLVNTSLRTYSLSAGASRIVDWGHYGAAYRYYDNGYGIPGGFVGSHPEGVRVEMRRHAVHGLANVTRRTGPFTGFTLDAKYTNYYHRELEAEDIIGTEFGLLTGAAEATARHEGLAFLDAGVIGVRAGWQDFAAGGSTLTPSSVERNIAFYALEEVDVGDVRLQAGIRYGVHQVQPGAVDASLDIGDVRTRTFDAVSASLGGVYEIVTGLSVGASVARAYRTPDTNELYSRGPHLAAYSFEVGNPDLDVETGIGVDMFVRVHRDRFHAELAGFRNTLDHYIYYRRTGDQSTGGLPIYQATGANALLTGFELSGSLEPVRHVVLNGTLSHVRGTLVDTDSPLPMMPPLRSSVTARYERPRYFAGLTWRAVATQDRIAEFETETDGYNVFDADAGFRWTAFGRVQSVTVRLDNLTNEVVQDHLSRIKDVMPGAGIGASAIYRVVF